MLKLVPIIRSVSSSVGSLRSSVTHLSYQSNLLRHLSFLEGGCGFKKRRLSFGKPLGMDLKDIVKVLETIAPSSTAEEWDNVGLLLEPSGSKPITHILLTNDLTEPVIEEALQLKERGQDVGLIISYHPPIFRPFKRLTQSSAKDRIVLKAIESKIAIYSPHTAHDALWGGVNDWALSGIQNGGTITPLSMKQMSDNKGLVVKVGGVKTMEACGNVIKLLKDTLASDSMVKCGKSSNGLDDVYVVECKAKEKVLATSLPIVTDRLSEYSLTVSSGDKVPIPGAGRLLSLPKPITMSSLIAQVKAHFRIPHLRLALPEGVSENHEVTTVAVCVGSGSSVLNGVSADVYLTGEMSHHDMLNAVSRGVACILCEHSNTERGFLSDVFKGLLEDRLGGGSGVTVLVSRVDKDPVTIV